MIEVRAHRRLARRWGRQAVAAAAAAGAIGCWAFGVEAKADCAGLAHAAVAGLEQVEAQEVAAGALPSPDAAAGAPSIFADLPAFCRVRAAIRTSPSSRIRIEVWMPQEGWNGRFLPAGWAFYAGTMSPNLLAGPLRGGYATATTDGGGVAGEAAFLLEPEKLVDWGERAWGQTTLKAKALIAAYYGRPAEFSYWNGGGGASRQGLKEVQRFPGDFDGAALGGLAADPSHFVFAQVAAWAFLHGTGLTAEHLPAIHRAALAACDADDGVENGVIGDPERCRFDPVVIQCRDEASTACLTPVQVAAVRKMYQPVTNPRTKAVIFGPLMPGSELGWGSFLTPEPGGFALDFFRYVVFQDGDWDYRTLDYDRDVARAERVDGSVNALNPHIDAFLERGGKVLMWGGWSDTAIPPSANIDYYEAVLAAVGPEARDSVRLYMIPGMGHFLGTTGPDAYDLDTQAALEAWREGGQTPGRLVAVHRSNGVQDRTVLLCPYPEVAIYGGQGDPADASSFECRRPSTRP